MATVGMDFAEVLANLNVTNGVTAIIGAGALVAGVGFCIALTNAVAAFFDSGDEEEERGDWEETAAGQAYLRHCCRKCGDFVEEAYDLCEDCWTIKEQFN